MNRTGLIIVSNLSRLSKTFQASRQHVSGTLYVQLYVPKHLPSLSIGRFSEIVTSIYTSSLYDCRDLDVRVLVPSSIDSQTIVGGRSLDVLMLDGWLPEEELYRVRQQFQTKQFINFSEDAIADKNGVFRAFEKKELAVSGVNNVVLGGTFDRLHVGHKLLLTDAVIRAKRRLVVGVTDTNMIASKLLPELILPVIERIKQVTEFLMSIDNSLKYEVVPIQDPFGPTKSDPDLDLIVVSQETLRGGNKVNELRADNGLNQLAVHCIELVELERDSALKEIKISSSNQRLDLLGTRIRDPLPNLVLPMCPYIIGLVGGIASGFEKIGDNLAAKGALVIDCDKLAEELSNQDERKNDVSFNSAFADGSPGLWPELRQKIKDKINEGKNSTVIVLQGNINQQAGWQDDCHETWAVIIPEKEAMRRLTEVKHIPQEVAVQLLRTNSDNKTLVDNANVVISTAWDQDFTDTQITRAWSLLNVALKENEK